MGWIDKIDKHVLLGGKRFRRERIITPLAEERKCTYWTDTIPRGGEPLELGSPKSIAHMTQENVSLFLVGYFGDFEVELFYLIKGSDHIWNAYRDDCDEMFRIDDIHELNYELVAQISREFGIKANNKRIKENRNQRRLSNR